MASNKTPDTIEHRLTQDILRGRYAVGSRLPTVRELANRNGVNPATIQRAVSRLEARGLVRARQGSGIVVNDPVECGDISLIPYWLEAVLDDPARASGMLADLLEMRRVMGARLLVRHRDAILADHAELVALAEAMSAAVGLGLGELRRADLAFTRQLLRASRNVVAMTLLNTITRVLEELPVVAEAMYANPTDNAAAMMVLVDALVSQSDDAVAVIEQSMATIDARTVERFGRLLAARPEHREAAR
jgi:GntR family transcriptional repressor for pyruvate dehydrogenase complex